MYVTPRYFFSYQGFEWIKPISQQGMYALFLAAMQAGSKDRYFQDTGEDIQKLVPEGIEGRVPYKGPLGDTVYQMVGGLRAAMGYCGATVAELSSKGEFVQITSCAGMHESHVHDVQIVKEAPNYRVG